MRQALQNALQSRISGIRGWNKATIAASFKARTQGNIRLCRALMWTLKCSDFPWPKLPDAERHLDMRDMPDSRRGRDWRRHRLNLIWIPAVPLEEMDRWAALPIEDRIAETKRMSEWRKTIAKKQNHSNHRYCNGYPGKPLNRRVIN